MNSIELTITSKNNPKEDWMSNLQDFMTEEQKELYLKIKDKPTYKETFIGGRCAPYPVDPENGKVLPIFDGYIVYIEW